MVPVMTSKTLKTEDKVRGQKDDRLLPHQIRRPVCLNCKSETGCGRTCSSDMLGLVRSPAKSQRKMCERISCVIEGVYTFGLCISRFLSKKVYST